LAVGEGPVIQIVNVDARINDLQAPASVFLPAGTYEVVAVGVEQGGAWNAWTGWWAHNCGQPTGCRATWPTTTRGWRNEYDVLSPELLSAAVDGTPLIPLDAPPAFEVGSYFLADGSAARYHVGDVSVYPDALAALSAALTSTFTIDSPGPVGFSIADQQLTDNQGGMSLRVLRQ
jgi:hypothetical protein